MKLLSDFFPIVLFFVAYKFHGIFIATAAAIAATLLQVGIVWYRTRKVEPMHLVTLGLIVVFGGATLIFQDELFIKWKPTVLNWALGLGFLLSRFVGERTLIERMMGRQIDLPKALWQRLNLAWVLFFLTVGAANLFVVYSFDTETWVNFKLFGMMGLTLMFVVAQSIFLARHVPDAKTEE
ncbi:MULTISPECIES: septation protein A [Methylococcus]|uniref:Inner membrane-spanning protein YciB n=1 Tax=Methylococcus capsulatus TaxID=414 RepID=A0ABZ2F4B5_METCP|nr:MULTISPECIES: septation protein A [Methylococcus]MDF9391823.1 septation protein A [Methylococcus capsulatus]